MHIIWPQFVEEKLNWLHFWFYLLHVISLTVCSTQAYSHLWCGNGLSTHACSSLFRNCKESVLSDSFEAICPTCSNTFLSFLGWWRSFCKAFWEFPLSGQNVDSLVSYSLLTKSLSQIWHFCSCKISPIFWGHENGLILKQLYQEIVAAFGPL